MNLPWIYFFVFRMYSLVVAMIKDFESGIVGVFFFMLLISFIICFYP